MEKVPKEVLAKAPKEKEKVTKESVGIAEKLVTRQQNV